MLTLDNESWVTNLDMNELTISRFFIVHKINDSNYFANVNFTQSVTIVTLFLLCYGFLIIYAIYYEKSIPKIYRKQLPIFSSLKKSINQKKHIY